MFCKSLTHSCRLINVEKKERSPIKLSDHSSLVFFIMKMEGLAGSSASCFTGEGEVEGRSVMDMSQRTSKFCKSIPRDSME